MPNALALRTHEPTEPPAPLAPRFSFNEMKAMAKDVADSRLFPGVQNAQQALTLMLLCDAEGLHPINALRRYHIIEGRPSMRADAIQAEFQAKGGTIRWDRSDAEVCIATFFHPTHAPDGETVEVRIADLDRVGITKGKEGPKKNWRQFPRQMLRARAISEGVRMVLPGVIVGIYTPEEVADFSEFRPQHAAARVILDPDDGNLSHVEPAPDESRRRINEEFRPRQPAAPNVPDREAAFKEHISRMVRQINDTWHTELVTEGIPKDQRADLTNFARLVNALGTMAIESGQIAMEAVAKDGKPDVRDPDKLRKALAEIYADDPDSISGDIGAYCHRRLDEERPRLGIPVLDEHDDGSAPEG